MELASRLPFFKLFVNPKQLLIAGFFWLWYNYYINFYFNKNMRQLTVKQKKYLYIGGVSLIFIFALLLILTNKEISNFSSGVNQNTFSTSTSSTAPSPNKNTNSAKTAPLPLSATQRYLDAIKIYKTSGYYFQFVSCHGMPGSLTLKKGKKFMLDNRDAVSHKIAIVGGQSFAIGGYNFAIATAPYTAGTHYITCDGGGAASILVQQ